MKSICGIDCTNCELCSTCNGCAATEGQPFGAECLVAQCCKKGKTALSEMNLPGASPQVLCSAPTSPLTVLAFYICLRICKSGVSGIPCLSHYTKSEKLSCPSTISP